MEARWTPLRWPDSWKDAALLDLVKGTAFDCLIMSAGADLDPVRRRAREAGYLTEAPAGVSVAKREWPGVRTGRGENASSGPTGVPWVNSNGWLIRLEMALHPESTVWIDAPPVDTFVTADSALIAIADAASYGGRWIVTLDSSLAASLAAGKAEAQKPWKRIVETAAFFAAHKEWSRYVPVTNIGVVSDFKGPNEFFSRELLNLLSRAGAHPRAVPPGSTLEGLRVVLYADAAPPSAALKRQMAEFVKSGGRVMSTEQRPADDPYTWANDACVLMSHRYDLVRFWNGGATGSFVATAPGGKETVAHLLFYSERGPDSATVRVAGRYRIAKASTVEHPAVEILRAAPQAEAIEVHLPLVSQYVALQLES